MGTHPPPPEFVGHLSFWQKNVANAPPLCPYNATKSPPLGTYIDANAPPPWGQNISFLRNFELKNSVAISFQNVLIKVLKSQNLI